MADLTNSHDRFFRESLARVIPEQGEMIMPTLAQQWIDEGKEQGFQQGLQQASRQKAHTAVIEVLVARFGVVPQSLIEALGRIAQETVLSMLLRRAAVAESLDAFREDMQRALS